MSIVVNPDKLLKYVTEIFVKAGLNPEYAETVADNLVQAELRGVRSHGLVQVKNYVEWYASGRYNTKPEIRVLRESDATILIDADHGPGSVVGKFAMNRVIEKAKKTGVATGAVRNGTHFGMAAYYALDAVEEDMIGFAFTNSPTLVAPYGGYIRELGTNPICIAVPADKHKPVVFDAATSEAAYNKIFFARTEGRKIPLNWAVDGNGEPTDDPGVAIDEGALVPFGGYKGFGLAFIVNILTGILSGSSIAHDENGGQVEDIQNVGFNFGAVDISRFADKQEFKQAVDIFIERTKESARKNSNIPIYIPGEPEDIRKEKALRDGLEIYDGTERDLVAVGELLGAKLKLSDCAI